MPAPALPDSRPATSLTAWLGVLVLLVLVVLAVTLVRRLGNNDAPASDATPRTGQPASAPGSASPPAPPSSTVVPAPELVAPAPAAPAALASPPLGAAVAPALEDVLEAALPAVVVIETPRGTGSGFFINDVTAVTSAHVVAGQALVTIRLRTGDPVAARVAAINLESDLALLRTPAPTAPRPALKLGTATTAKVGQQVLVIGSPLGTFANTVTRGIVSAVRNFNGIAFIQTDAAINPGNSGGPVMNVAGEVLGVATGKYMGGESLGFAVAIDHAQPLLSGGGSPPAAVRAPPAPGSTSPRPERAEPDSRSNMDALREQGTQVYERNMQTLAQAADRVDAEWRRVSAPCLKASPASRGADRSWFPLATGSSIVDETIPKCAALAANLMDYVRQIAAGMRETADQARRAGVYPGVQREIRRRYRMDWDGWR